METKTNSLRHKEHRLTVYATKDGVRLETFGHLKIV